MSGLVTVFGASGFIGRHVVRALAQDGWRVRAVCRHPHMAEFLMTAGTTGQVQICRGNIRDKAAIRAALAGADAAVNLVGVLHSKGRQNFEALHSDAAGHIAEAAKECGVSSMVHISAIGANRTAPAHYAQSKGDGEMRVRESFADAVILRPSLVFGPEDDFFNKFAWIAQYAPALPLICGGHTRFQPVYAGDVARAVAQALTDTTVRGKTFELGGPKTYSFKELMRYILALTGRKRLLVPLPGPMAKITAAALQLPTLLLPVAPLLTVDQVRLLATDAVVSPGAFTLADLNIRPRAIEDVVPAYLNRFRNPVG